MDKHTICVVDDDEDARKALRLLLETEGYAVKDYPSAIAFLDGDVFAANCLIADLRMPGMDGLTLLREAARRRQDLPVVIVSGFGDVDLAVQAMKSGAADFLEKPFDGAVLLASIKRVLAFAESQRNRMVRAKAARRLLAGLTPREKTVLEELVGGLSNKAVAQKLGISPRTVEVYRAQIMTKLKAGNLSDLVRMTITASEGSGTLYTVKSSQMPSPVRDHLAKAKR